MTSCACTSDPVSRAIAECTALLKAENLDAWLSILLAPAAARPALLAVWSLVAEQARLPWTLKEPLLARIRMAFWREALLGENETIAAERTPLLRLWPPALPREDLALTLAEMQRLAEETFRAEGEVFSWSERTFSPLFRTLLNAVGISRDGARLARLDFAALEAPLRNLSAAYGVGFLLRRRPFPRTSTRAPLFGGDLAEEDSARQLAKRALLIHEEAVRKIRLPRRRLVALSPTTLMNLWLRRGLRTTGFPNAPAPAPPRHVRQWHLWRHYLTARL